MKKLKFLLIALMLLMVAPVSAQTKYTVPVTGRKVKLWVSDEQVLSLSSQEYESYLKSVKISTDATNTALVKKVGQRLATAVETYLKENNRRRSLTCYAKRKCSCHCIGSRNSPRSGQTLCRAAQHESKATNGR